MSDRASLVRAATAADSAAILAIWAANGDVIPEGGVDIVTPYLAHLMRTGRVLVAEDPERVVGVAAVVERGGVTHLADLFVVPERHGQGIGRRLLGEVLAGAGSTTTFASSDPHALPLYARAGMTPYWPNLYLDGEASQLPQAPRPLACGAAAPDELATLERRWLGHADAGDHRFWASLPGARPFVVHDAGRPVAIVHARVRRSGRDRWINRLVAAPDVDVVQVVMVAYGHASEGGRIGSCLPGPNPALAPLLDSGFRIIDRDTFMASDASSFDATRRISDGGIL